MGIRQVKRLEQFERGQLTGDNSTEVNLPGRIYLILQKRTSEKFKCEFDFALQIFQVYLLFKYL